MIEKYRFIAISQIVMCLVCIALEGIKEDQINQNSKLTTFRVSTCRQLWEASGARMSDNRPLPLEREVSTLGKSSQTKETKPINTHRRPTTQLKATRASSTYSTNWTRKSSQNESISPKFHFMIIFHISSIHYFSKLKVYLN